MVVCRRVCLYSHLLTTMTLANNAESTKEQLAVLHTIKGVSYKLTSTQIYTCSLIPKQVPMCYVYISCSCCTAPRGCTVFTWFFVTPSMVLCPVHSIISCLSIPALNRWVAAVACREWLVLWPVIPVSLQICCTIFQRVLWPTALMEYQQS